MYSFVVILDESVRGIQLDQKLLQRTRGRGNVPFVVAMLSRGLAGRGGTSEQEKADDVWKKEMEILAGEVAEQSLLRYLVGNSGWCEK